MKTLNKLIFIGCILLFSMSCEKSETLPNPVVPEGETVVIGQYEFSVVGEHDLVVDQGIDSQIGSLIAGAVHLRYDYGWYTGPVSNLPPDQYEVEEVTIDGHYRQIVKSIDPALGYVRIHFYKIDDKLASPHGYNSLTMESKDLSPADQAEALTIIYTGVAID
ncbi:MAG: hypothetical protein AB8G15_21100 [Saprospiraceae bacterium]